MTIIMMIIIVSGLQAPVPAGPRAQDARRPQEGSLGPTPTVTTTTTTIIITTTPIIYYYYYYYYCSYYYYYYYYYYYDYYC